MTRKQQREDQGDLFAWGATQEKAELPGACNGSPAANSVASKLVNVDPAPAIDCLRNEGSQIAIDFISRRDRLPRRILNPPPPFVYLDRQIARKHGIEPPAPIIPFALRAAPPAHADGGAPLGEDRMTRGFATELLDDQLASHAVRQDIDATITKVRALGLEPRADVLCQQGAVNEVEPDHADLLVALIGRRLAAVLTSPCCRTPRLKLAPIADHQSTHIV